MQASRNATDTWEVGIGDWRQAGVWEALHHRLLDWLGDDGQIDWSRAAIDSVSVRARRVGSLLAQTRSTAARLAPSTTC